MRVDGETINDLFPNIKKIITAWLYFSYRACLATERATSETRILKTPFQSIMEEKRESDMNLLQLQEFKDTVDERDREVYQRE